MRPVTLQRASHTEAGSQRSPPLSPEVSCDTGRAEAGRGDFDEAGAGSDRTRGQWGSFPWSPLIISPRKGHKMDIFAIIILVQAPTKNPLLKIQTSVQRSNPIHPSHPLIGFSAQNHSLVIWKDQGPRHSQVQPGTYFRKAGAPKPAKPFFQSIGGFADCFT